jgi:hypothetical protein
MGSGGIQLGEAMKESRIPYAVIITLLVQAAGILIWASQLDTRDNAMEQRTASGIGLNEKFARLEERLENMKQDIGGIRRELDRLTDKLLKP